MGNKLAFLFKNFEKIFYSQPVIYIPLFVIVIITALKDLFEDCKRHKSDNEENNRRVLVIFILKMQFYFAFQVLRND